MNHASLQLISDKIQIIQIIRFYLSLVRSVAYGESEVKLFVCKEITNRWQFSFSKGEKWYDKLFNVKYLPLFHHFKAIYRFPKHIIFLVKIVANASLIIVFVVIFWMSRYRFSSSVQNTCTCIYNLSPLNKHICRWKTRTIHIFSYVIYIGLLKFHIFRLKWTKWSYIY